MPALTCPACGSKIPLRARFCDECGTPLAPAVPSQSGAGWVITIGRADDNDVVLDYPMVSSYHARITVSGGEAVLEDLDSTNGTAVGAPDRKVKRAAISPSDTVYFGSIRMPAARLLGGDLTLGADAGTTVAFQGDTLLLGRDPEAGVVLDYPMISWHHARLRRSGQRVIVEDLGSTNGTFVNGHRISGAVLVGPDDQIGLGSYVFRLAGFDRIEQRDYRGNVSLEARGVAVDVPRRRLVEGVSLTLYPSELVGLMGPSGSGKTTLMSALNGYVRPSAGAVLFNGQDLYAAYDQFRMHIGYVPQDDIMHRDLTVRQALYYTARLRLPRDMSDGAIHARIDEVLAQLHLTEAANVLIGSPERKGVSGGQRKRVNLAMELLTDPFILFLDEPTSGLSSEDALVVMKLLRQLADAGKTILLTIHQPSRDVFRLMDGVVLLGKDPGSAEPARLAYYGPAYPDAIHFFAPGSAAEPEPSPDLLLRGLGARPAAEWATRYAASETKKHYVDERAGKSPVAAAPTASHSSGSGGGFAQWSALVRRSLAIKLRDTWNTAILLGQAPIIALLIVAVFGSKASQEPAPDKWLIVSQASTSVLFLMVVAALWFGCSNSAREIVGEWAIYHRERMINLKIPAYVASKLAVLGALCLVQCACLLGVAGLLSGLRGDWLPMLGVLWLAALIGVAVGLLISATARSPEIAISLVPLVLLPMVILGGMLAPTHEMNGPVRLLSGIMPSRWAFEGVLLVETRAFPMQPVAAPPAPAPSQTAPAGAVNGPKDLAEHYFPADRRSTLAGVTVVSCVMLALFIGATAAILKSRDVH
ncbi:MAG TPA: FHA domain-containing protein [Thermoanaerobaculia bacterium]|nr:FHA domain-containing protein [Thermoanaerobaculia bacterium]